MSNWLINQIIAKKELNQMTIEELKQQTTSLKTVTWFLAVTLLTLLSFTLYHSVRRWNTNVISNTNSFVAGCIIIARLPKENKSWNWKEDKYRTAWPTYCFTTLIRIKISTFIFFIRFMQPFFACHKEEYEYISKHSAEIRFYQITI